MRALLLGTTLLVISALGVRALTGPEPSLYDLKANKLDGTPADLAQYRGHVVLVINTASKCGYTPQYAGLEKLYTEYKDKGFFVLGFPSNDFKQEPGTAQEITNFCTGTYHVTFPMFEKVGVVKGPNQAPVYQFLTATFPQPTWNFCKYLVDRNGKVLQFFPKTVTPQDKQLTDAIDAALKQN